MKEWFDLITSFTNKMLSSIFQTEAWTTFKETMGWQGHRFEGVFGLERAIGFGKKLMYFPELPLNDRVVNLIRAVKSERAPKNRIFSRFEFLELWTPEKAKKLLELGLVKAFEDVQPDHRQWIPLDQSEDDLLKAMKPKGRYNIRIAERHNLKVEWGTGEELLEEFYSLYEYTAKRTGFSGRNRAYFAELLKVLVENNLGQIVVVRHQNEPVSAAIITFYGGIASYLYGGSGGDRSLMAPYLMHWESIKRAKKEGCALYDLLAIAPIDRESHVHAGLTRFKTQFGGESVRLLGSWDLVQNRFWYTLYALAQKRRRRAVS